LDPGGKGKMSKRKTRGPGGREYLVLVKDFITAGYLPDALTNFIARLGWSYDDHTELFSRGELVERFDLDGVNVSPARFDYDKLEWMNGVYIRQADVDELAEQLLPVYAEAGLDADLDTVRQIVPLIQERIKTLRDAVPWSGFIFAAEIEPDAKALIAKKMDAASSLAALRKARAVIAGLEPFTTGTIEAALRTLAAELDVKVGPLFGILRGAVTGQRVSPPLFETMEIMGRERVLVQADRGIEALEHM
jgi:glutamyl-tRNA synthetase